MIQTIDFAVLDWIQQNMRCEFLDALMRGLSVIGEYGAVWIAVTVLLLLLKAHRKCGLQMTAGLISGLLVGNVILKRLINRPRPFTINTDMTLLVSAPHGSSFPSGHAIACFVAATILLRYDKRMGIPALILAILISFSRLYLYVHFPSDVLAGALIGVALGFLVGFAAKRIKQRRLQGNAGEKSGK